MWRMRGFSGAETEETMKILAIILNFLFPGIGTLVVRKFTTGIIQVVLVVLGGILTATGVLAIIGIPLVLGALVWSIITVVRAPAPV